ncbi:histone deacetylase family protein [Curvibacter sp. CHRR-16]|uniref:histone deacetylase family protein n=1 Tax=Curvibacter sp. CHRR-16 TaxID=2835872 RepID=UPI001BDB3AFA|nr:histone deacetylase family protein [Curvibacter sp. CHRR-16]MBT0569916.1 histone deacetylase family protein [Curvibacter sp. CHRR-16]
MITFFNHLHAAHQGRMEMFRGRLVPCYEVPNRADYVLQELQVRPLGAVQQPAQWADSHIERIHEKPYLDFLCTAWDRWLALDSANAEVDILPSVWPGPTLRRDVQPQNFSAQVGLYCFDAGTPLTAGTWQAARAGADCALSAAQAVLDGEKLSFALSRPPGHHAGANFYGGYCFLNNAAIAAEHLRQGGAEKVAVLDIDYHHGNGTQACFYDRSDVFFASVHGDPVTEYPFYLGYADETGVAAGVGANLNIPLPRGTDYARWAQALDAALDAITRYGVQALVLSLGMDTFEGDPISGFKLRSDDYFQVGARLARLALPVVVIFEGGYAVREVGINAVNLLHGLAKA